jgi:hypothetical protein
MKILNTLLFALFISTFFAQIKTPAASPKGMFTQTVGLTDIEVEYSRPSAKGRVVFGDVVPYNKMWRTGANANSTIQFSSDVKLNGQSILKGKYAIFTIPNPNEWSIILYKTHNHRGTPQPFLDSLVALKLYVTPEKLPSHVETFTIQMDSIEMQYANLNLMWEKTLIPIKMEVPTSQLATENIKTVMSGPLYSDYYAAAQYFFQTKTETKLALSYIDKAIQLKATEIPFWYTRLQSELQALNGDYKSAIKTAKISLEAAQKANNLDYVKMNQNNIEKWSSGKK